MRDFRGRRFVAVIGSRETPDNALRLLEDVGEVLCDAGVAITSGDADGADKAGIRGAMRSASWPLVGARVYLPWNGVGRTEETKRWADNRIYFDASKFPNWEDARELAFKARGSFEGLGRGGIALQTRNAYQILLDDLKTPVASAILYAKPIGKSDRVSGGTNTAYQIARAHNVPIVNLATDEGMQKILTFLEKKGKRS